MAKTVSTKEQNNFADLVAEVDSLRAPKKGDIMTGKIVGINRGSILVDVGWKSEGIVAGRELKSEIVDFRSLKVDDDILVYVVSQEDEEGMLVLSIRRTDKARRWFDLEEAHQKNSPIEATIIESNSGGLICDIVGGIRGFIPTMQVDTGRIFSGGQKLIGKDVSAKVQENLATIVGETIKVGIMELDRSKGKVILSEKMVTQQRDSKLREETLRKMKIGDVIEGQVSGIVPFGIFVNAGGVEGLVHLSELSWDKVENTADLYSVGDSVKVLVIDVTDGGKRVAYSVKRLQKDPWKEAIAKFKVGDVVDGTVQKIVNYGFFVRIGDGLNGLVHISEVSYDLVKDISSFVQVGQKVKVKILSISSTERHLRLSMKRATEKTKETETKATEEEA